MEALIRELIESMPKRVIAWKKTVDTNKVLVNKFHSLL